MVKVGKKLPHKWNFVLCTAWETIKNIFKI